MFNEAGELSWPLGLRILPPAEEIQGLRQEIEASLREAWELAEKGKGNRNVINEAERAIGRLQRLLVLRADRLPTSAYTVTEARGYLRRLQSFAQSLGKLEKVEE
jgi:hypothetical protein